MLGRFVDGAAIGALALEHGARIVQAMGQHVDLGIHIGNELAVNPDDTGHLIKWHCCGSHGSPPASPNVTRDVALLLRPGSSLDMVRWRDRTSTAPQLSKLSKGRRQRPVSMNARSFRVGG